MHPMCLWQAVPAHSHRARHGDSGAGGDAATHGGDIPLSATSVPMPDSQKGRMKRIDGGGVHQLPSMWVWVFLS